MNTRLHNIDLVVTPRQVVDATKAVFHTVLLHRSTGKYSYSSHHPGTYSVGTVGIVDCDCSSVEFTYVRCAGDDLDHSLSEDVARFAGSLCQQQGMSARAGKISLEFYERRKGRWLLPSETVSWETWQLNLQLADPSSDAEWMEHQRRLADGLAEAVVMIAQVVNRPDYIPRNPTSDGLSNVFDTQFTAVQPYLHKVSYELEADTMAGAVRKLIRNTFAY